MKVLISADMEGVCGVTSWVQVMPPELGQEPSSTVEYERARLRMTREVNAAIEGAFEAGADDYVIKPFDRDLLRARISAGERIVNLQNQYAAQVDELKEALDRVQKLEGLLPICSYCKKIRNQESVWQQVEEYITKYSKAKFSHGICPDCYQKQVESKDL